MLVWLLALLSVYWIAIGVYSSRFLSRNWHRLASYFRKRPDMEAKYLPYYRDDFHLWNKQAILRNCFITLPVKFAALLSLTAKAVVYIYMIVGVEKLIGRRSPFLRRLFQLYMNCAGRVLCWIFISVKETNLNEPGAIEPIIVSNHVSWLEIFYLVSCRWPISFIAKEEIRRMPLVGTIATFGDSIYVDRGASDARKASLDQIKERAAQVRAGEKPPVVVFAEGTTTNGSYVINFKTGAFEPMEEVKLMGLKYECENFNVGLDQTGTLCHILLTFCHSPSLEIVISNNFQPQGSTPEQFSEAARAEIARMVGATPIESRFRDKQDFHEMLKSQFAEQLKKQQ